MCDMALDLNTPIRRARCESRFGLLVCGTADDPIDVRSTIERYQCYLLGSFGASDALAGSPCTSVLATCVESKSSIPVVRKEPPAYTPDGKPSENSGCVDWGTISTDEDEIVDANDGQITPISAPLGPCETTFVTKGSDERSTTRIDHTSSPIRTTPAKRPKVTLRMQSEFMAGSDVCSSHEAGIVSTDPQACYTTNVLPPVGEVPSLTSGAVAPSNAINNVPRWKTYRHKVLLKLRKKRVQNNYDLALFLLIKFGGPDTSAGRSIIEDSALLECSLLSQFPNDEDLRSFYLRQRASLMTALSQRMPVNTLSPVQLHRKLAKMLPPNRWFNRHKLMQKVADQERWNPFSIFGSSLPYVDVSEVFGTSESTANDITSSVLTDNTNTPVPYAQSGQQGGYALRSNRVDVTPGINWSGDPLMLDEVLWYLEATGKYVDKSRQVCTLQRCYCVTPDPHIAFNWNDARNAAWRDYRGPRASMGQLLSPSVYEESLRDHERLCNELKATPCVEGSSDTVAVPGTTEDSGNGDSTSSISRLPEPVAPRSLESGCGDAAGCIAFTPQTRRVKEQRLVFYRNYFEANRQEAPQA
ncbi:uncharacterized protein BXIN_2315 [Babesia sp. Xinjiang]|uniref:uncharacterized protein n=1 Tax=Babesia sp. Xinjiang TaxID=462227 RepID=UPI000A21F64C|nr:uncharacterized protein BXIN_2315 [Babesia sp. Xinjiang]ORM40744.1 hypothetical protein BXIN_2315 [Babesia sp. Xinjiang]